MADVVLMPSFMMLSVHMYDTFVQYIEEGRTRAPPESELSELLPTFQFGAKTDRRALQSKFKSWAKRMNVENGDLVLTNSGKIILPKEKCIDLVLSLHSEKHTNLETIITQIKEKYSWSRKNFGMDREFVVDIIATNCKKEDCVRRMLKAYSHSKFLKGSPTLLPQSALTELNKEMPSQLQLPPMHPFQLSFPAAFPMFFPNNIPFPSSIFHQKVQKDFSMSNFCTARNFEDELSAIKLGGEMSVGPLAGKISSTQNPTTPEISPLMKFKKSANIDNYKILMATVRRAPNMYPKILGTKKTFFLSELGIAPKSICSSKAIRQVQREQKNKQVFHEACAVLYGDRKVLRDRNKLKMNSNTKRTYMEIQKNDALASQSKYLRVVKGSAKESRFLSNGRKVNKGKISVSNETRMKRHSPPKKVIEVIDIASSDDETAKDNIVPPEDTSATKDESAAPKLSNETPNPAPARNDDQITSDTTPENSKKTRSKTNPQTLATAKIGYSEKPASCFPLQIMPNPCQAIPQPKLCQRFLLPKILKPCDAETNHTNSKTAVRKTYCAIPTIVRPAAQCKKKHPNCAFTRVTPDVIGVRQGVSANKPLWPYCAAANIVPRSVYQIPMAKIDIKSKLLCVEKGETSPLLLVPRFLGDQNGKAGVSVTASCSQDKDTIQHKTEGKIPDHIQKTANNLYGVLLEASLRKDRKENMDITEVMKRISNWILRMKAAVNPTMFQSGVEKSAQNIISQLDVGIALVREARKSLLEIEQEMNNRRLSTENSNSLL